MTAGQETRWAYSTTLPSTHRYRGSFWISANLWKVQLKSS